MRRLLTLLALPALLGAAPAPPAEPVEYLVTPSVGAQGLERIGIAVHFRGEADGETRLALPDRWAGSERLYEAIEGLRAEGGSLAATDDPAWRTISHAPGAMLTVNYTIRLGATDPAAGYEKARPVVRPGWFYVHGEGAFVVPSGRGEAPARLRWGEAPLAWQLASSAELAEADTLTVDRVVESILIGGVDLRVRERAVGGKLVRIVLRGSWPFADDALIDGLARAVAAENAYLEAAPVRYFVSLIPLTGAETGTISFGGSGRTGGFALAATGNVGLDRLLPMLAHEYGHRWFGGALGPMPEPDAPDFWFSEGFNDFVAARALVRSGVWSASDYAERINEVLFRYAASSARTLGNDALAVRFWEDGDAMQMPYDRGHLFALLLDTAGTGIRDTLVRMAARPESFPADQSQARRFVAVAAVPAARLESMLRGEPIALPTGLFDGCGTMEWVEQPAYASGYTVEERPDGTFFATVHPAGPAWAAGLRPGMRYVRREAFRYRDATAPLVLRVADAQGERVLSWLPRGSGTVRFQRLTLAPRAAEAETCRARLRGR